MKRNKNTYLLSYLILPLVFLFSCESFLEEEPRSQLGEEQMFENENNINKEVFGLYSLWRDTRVDRGPILMILGTDGIKQGGQQVHEISDQAALDLYNSAMGPDNSTIAGLWNSRWIIVSNVAKVIHNTSEDETRAEALFLRGAVNYELTMYWGPIPLIDMENEDLQKKRQPLDIVYSSIIEDLEYAANNLPESQDNKSLPTKFAAQALLGKVLMSAPEETGLRDYERAIQYFDEVIPNYSLLPDYKDLFDTSLDQNSNEIIYAFQFRNSEPDNNLIQNQVGSRAVADLDQLVYFAGYDLGLPTKYYYQDVWDGTEEEGDTRRNASIRYDFTLPDGTVPGITWTGQKDELEPHTKKFEDIRTQGKQNFRISGGLVYYLRLADILLSKAECLNELDRTSEAIELVNSTVRNRAFEGQLSSAQSWSNMSKTGFRDKIMDERMRELGFEGWRRIDLVRTGKFVEYVRKRNPWSGNVQEFHKWWPIPNIEINSNENFGPEDQNEGY